MRMLIHALSVACLWIGAIGVLIGPSGMAMAGGSSGSKATRLERTAPGFVDLQIAAAKSMPPLFQLRLNREMPSPGWTFVVDQVSIDEEAGRIVVRVTETAPDGVAAQVLTSTVLAIELGTLAPGNWVLEIRSRRGTTKYEPAFTTILTAQ